jgi:FkbM family methyltransferase
MKITYGLINNNIDVTEICLTKLMKNNIIRIPSGDNNRDNIFTDPIPGTHKKIFILHNGILTNCEEKYTIKINIIDKSIKKINDDIVNNNINNTIKNIHSKLKIQYGNFNEELPEQKMVVRYLTGNKKVLEIGGNIGRNSLVIAHILGKNSNNFVTLESNTNIADQLKENRDLNNLNFHIESSALSKRKLIQHGWNTMVSDTLLDGYGWVNTITLQELNAKYNIKFDTLVVDCEGAFYYILMDMPEILNNINLIIMENDYLDISHKQYINEILIKNNFYVDYVEAGGWGPCYNNFYEVWKK